MKNYFAERIKFLRQQRNLTFEQVGNLVGVGKSTVRKWETGMITNIKSDKIDLLAKALGTTREFLMGWDLPTKIKELESEIESLKLDIDSAPDDIAEEMEIALAVKLEEYEDLLFAQQQKENANIMNKKKSPDELQLTEGEKAMLELFRQVPEDQQQLVLQMIRAALNTSK